MIQKQSKYNLLKNPPVKDILINILQLPHPILRLGLLPPVKGPPGPFLKLLLRRPQHIPDLLLIQRALRPKVPKSEIQPRLVVLVRRREKHIMTHNVGDFLADMADHYKGLVV